MAAPISPKDRNVIKSMQQIMGLAEIEVPKLPENLFLSHILPLLLDTSGEADVSNWLDVAGTLTRPIDVIDGGGNVLFRVPALQQQLKTISNSRNGPSLSRMATHAELKRRQSPHAADQFLNTELAKVHTKPMVEYDLAPVIALNAIFARYNLPLIPIESTPVGAAAGVVEKSTMFTGDYDDI